MAIAINRFTNESQELPNQQANNQTETPNIPTPRNGHMYESLSDVQLFTTHISEQSIHEAEAYIDTSIKSAGSVRTGSFIIGLLERIHTLPSELSVEEAPIREQTMRIVEQLLIDYENFEHPSGKGYDTARFSREVTDRLSDDIIDQYPLVALLAQAVRRVRAKGNRSAEPLLVTAQRITLLGIAKQRGVYVP